MKDAEARKMQNSDEKKENSAEKSEWRKWRERLECVHVASSAIRSVFLTELSEGLHEKKIRKIKTSSGFSSREQWLFNENSLKRMEKKCLTRMIVIGCVIAFDSIWGTKWMRQKVRTKLQIQKYLRKYSSASHKPLLSVSAKNLTLNRFQVPKWKIQIHIGGERITTICAYRKGGINSHFWNMASTLEIENETPTSARRANRERQTMKNLN